MSTTMTETPDVATEAQAPKTARERLRNLPKKDMQVATTLTEADNERLLDLCEREGKKPAALLRELLLAHLDRKDRERERK